MNYTQIVSQEAPERELSSVEFQSISDSQPELVSSGGLQSRSSVLSEDWCRTVLGKPYANARVSSRGTNPLYSREIKPSDQGSADNIGNLLGKEDEDRPKSPVSKRVVPRVQNKIPEKIEHPQEAELSRDTKRVQEGAVVSNHKQNLTDSFVERTKGVPNSNTQTDRRKPRQSPCHCDEDSQTCPASILKSKAYSKSDPVFSNQRNKKTGTNGGIMDSYPEKESSPRSSRDQHRIVLTSDKVQQTADDLFFNTGRNTGSNTDRMETTDTSNNTFNSESARVQTGGRSSPGPEEEEYDVWHCGRPRKGHLCSCSPPRLSSLRRQSSCSSPSISPRTADSYRTSTAPKKPPAKQLDIRGLSEDSEYGYCVPSSYRKCPNYPCQQALRHKNPKPPRREHQPVLQKQRSMTPERRMVKVVPCDGSCRRCTRAPDICIDYEPVPCRSSPPYPSQIESSSSEERVEDDDEEDEEAEDDDDDANTSEGSRKHADLPYQNNEEYLELVQELEETLQSRNRNRVNRAMKEFEHKSKYNRPLERPILNYGEASESEEPIMKKISELTEKRRNCKGDCCSCRRNEIQDRQTPRPPRMKRPSTKPRKNPKRSPREQARWQIDNSSGEWFKICQNTPKRAPSTSRGPKKEHICGCACTCDR